jgi:dihydroneopterin aldolase
MRFHVRVGILAHERELPLRLEIDVDAWRAPHVALAGALTHAGLTLEREAPARASARG